MKKLKMKIYWINQKKNLLEDQETGTVDTVII